MNKLSALWMLFLIASISWAQNPNPKTVTLKGRVLEQSSDLPLEYATYILQKSADQSMVTGGITDDQGRFQVDIPAGNYDVVFEFISYTTVRLTNQNYAQNTDLGDVRMSADVSQLDEVELIAERSTVELRLDKKIYNVGKDMTVKGGSVTDVLDNVPSVSVDVEGGISLRGNESVRILINGKPSALSGLSNDALRLLPAEAIEKVEVITNPSSRYDAEGTAGIINIILRQNKTTGINGTTNLTLGDPKNEAGSLGLNLRQNKFNLFSNWTYRNQEGPGNSLYDQINYNDDGSIRGYQNEDRTNVRAGSNANANVGVEYFINPTTSITNSTVFGYSEGDNTTDIDFVNSDPNGLPLVRRVRNTLQLEQQRQFEYSFNLTKKFEKPGHELLVDYQYSESEGSDDSVIEETLISATAADVPTEKTVNQEDQRRALYQFNYVLPMGKENQSQFELGYRGGYINQTTTFIAGSFDPFGAFVNNENFSNTLEYREWIQAAYTQLGTKWDRFNFLGGLRMEHTDIDINLVETSDLNTKQYTNWFPSVFLGYSLNDEDQITLSYSKRLRRPWSRFINPFPSRSSNTNLFQGNPDLDPTFTDAYDLGMINQREKFTFNTSVYYNRSTGVFQFVTQETGELIEIENPNDPSTPILVPVQLRQPINLSTEDRYGFEFNTTFTPVRSWRFSWGINLFQRSLVGSYTYINSLNQSITQVFDNDNFSWQTNMSAKIVLPKDINFQTNIRYQGRSEDAQSINRGIASANLAMSKEILNKKGTLALNVSDLFNSRKRISDTRTLNVQTYSENQWRQRQVNLNFTYRFNQSLKDQRGRGRNGGYGDGQGGDMDMEFGG